MKFWMRVMIRNWLSSVAIRSNGFCCCYFMQNRTAAAWSELQPFWHKTRIIVSPLLHHICHSRSTDFVVKPITQKVKLFSYFQWKLSDPSFSRSVTVLESHKRWQTTDDDRRHIMTVADFCISSRNNRQNCSPRIFQLRLKLAMQDFLSATNTLGLYSSYSTVSLVQWMSTVV